MSRAVMAVLAVALSAPVVSTASHCSRVIVFSGIAPVRGANPNAGWAGCATPFEMDTNLIVPGATSAIVGWTGGHRSAPAGTIWIDGVTTALSGPAWDDMNARWTFAPVSIGLGPATVRATVWPSDDPSRAESATYRKLT